MSGGQILDNSATWCGGVFVGWAGVALSGNQIIGNSAMESGGGVCVWGAVVTLEGGQIISNSARGNGGGVFVEQGNATLINSVVADNRADGSGSGLYIGGVGGSARLLHTTIAHNGSDNGSGICVSGYWEGCCTIALTNTILVSHPVGIVVTAGNTATLEATLWGTDTWANLTDWGGDGTIITGSVNILGDPDFVNPDSGDYHIGPGSAAIDEGVPAGVPDDIDGDSRTDGYPDIGADELQFAAPNAAFTAFPLSGTAPLTVTFIDQSTGDITSWDWTFGDGGISGARHPGHEYTNPGSYTISLTISGPGGPDTEIKTDYIVVSPIIAPTWTFLLYLGGDNNLHYWFKRALGRLEAASANPHVAILVQFDGPGNGDTWRYKIQPGENPSWYMWELDMDDPQTLSDFVIWARDYYTTEHTYLAVADHGRGTTGIAWDDTSGSDYFITVAELRTALQDATADGAEPLDVVHYDACLMAMIEDAYQIKDYAHYLVASENLGWSVFAYDLYATQVATDTTPEILATAVVSEYHNALTGYPRTISALDLGQAITVTNAISTLATSLQNVLDEHKYHVNNARTATQKFDSRDYYVINNDDEYLDLYDLTRLLQQYVDDAAVDLAAQGVMDAVTAFVIAEEHESGYYRDYPYWDLDNAHGVSIYFPKEPGGWGYDDYINHVSFRFTVDTKWDEFLQDYYEVLGLPREEPVNPGRPPVLELPHEIYLPIVLRQ
jgi:PKD repeat protein